MKRILMASALGFMVLGSAFAQKAEIGSQIPVSGLNSQGTYQQSERKWRVEGDKCSSTFKYKGVNGGDEGRSQIDWTSATPYNGGHLCTNGTWRDLSGSGNSGRTGNIYIKNGKAYSVLSMQ